MRKKLLSVMAMYLAVVGVQSVVAQNTDATEILTEDKGYQLVTALPENLNDYYFVITEKRATKYMVTATQNDGPRYRYAVDPGTDNNVVWTIEPENGFNGYETGYAIKSLSMGTYIQPGGSDSWNVWLTAQTELTGITQFIFDYNVTDGYWTFKNGPNQGDQYLGTWDDVSGAFSSGDIRMAANKSGENIGQYIIYSIAKDRYVDYDLANYIKQLEDLKSGLTDNWNKRIDGLISEAGAASEVADKYAAIDDIKTVMAEISDYNDQLNNVLPPLIDFCESLYVETEASMGDDAHRTAYKDAIDVAYAALETAGSLEDVKKIIDQYKTALADFGAVAKPAEGSTLDFNYYVEGLSYSLDGWTRTYSCQNHAHKTSTEKNNGEYAVTQDEGFIENWDPNHFTTAGQLSYTLTELPSGIYTISAYAFDNVKSGKVQFFAGDQSVNIDATTDLFSLNTLENVKVDASGILTIGLKVTEANATNWVGISHIRMVKTGVLDNSELIASLQEKLVTANELVSQAMTAMVKEELTYAISEAEAINENSSISEISAVATALDAAILAAQVSIPEYAKFKVVLDEVMAKAETLKDYDVEAYEAAISEKTTAYNDGTLGEIDDEIMALYNILADAAKSQKWQEGADYTYAIINNSFEMGDLTGWELPNGGSSDTGVVTPDGSHATEGADGNYIFNTWWQGVPLTQTIEGLPQGKYTLSLLYTGEAPETSGFYVVANGVPSEKFTTAVTGTLQEVSTVATVGEDGKLVIWVQGSNQNGDYIEGDVWFWYKADNFRLTPIIEQTNVEISIPESGWTTMMLPFDAEIPADMKVYSCAEVDEEDVLVLEAVDAIKANVPYIIEGQTGVYPFSGVADSDEATYTAGILTGVYAETVVPAGAYILQTTAEDNLAFCKVAEGSEQTVAANSAYVWFAEGSELPAVYIPGRGVAVENVDAANVKVDVYTVSGIRIRANVNKADALKGLKGVYILKAVK